MPTRREVLLDKVVVAQDQKELDLIQAKLGLLASVEDSDEQ